MVNLGKCHIKEYQNKRRVSGSGKKLSKLNKRGSLSMKPRETVLVATQDRMRTSMGDHITRVYLGPSLFFLTNKYHETCFLFVLLVSTIIVLDRSGSFDVKCLYKRVFFYAYHHSSLLNNHVLGLIVRQRNER